jgi:hypothetical protein
MKENIITVILVALIIIALVFLVGLLVQFLWNWLIVGIYFSPVRFLFWLIRRLVTVLI